MSKMLFNKTAWLIIVLAFFIVQPVQCSGTTQVSKTGSDPVKPLVIVLVNSSIYEDVRVSLDQFKSDLEEFGFSARINETNQLSENTPYGIRDFLRQALPEGLVGALLVGDIATAWYKSETSQFPTDMYYMDLDGVWMDSNNDTVYERHVENVAPEIWIGRIKAPRGYDEVALINNYFRKNHDYKTHMTKLPWWRSLAYLDDQGVNWAADAKQSLSQVSPDVTLVTDRTTTNASNYKQMLEDPTGYQWLYLMSHGIPTSHTFRIPGSSGQSEWDGTVYSQDYESINPRVLFYMLFVCSAARFTEPDYLAGSIVFGNSYGLLAIGSTDLIVSRSYNDFYKSISEGATIGEAFLKWFVEQSKDYADAEQRYDFQAGFYGLTIIGDPTLRVPRENRDVSVTNVTVSIQNETGEETLVVDVTVENKGDFMEAINLTVYYDSEVKLVDVSLLLPSGSNATLTFTFPQAKRFIYSDHSLHVVEAMASPIPGEFETEDNTRKEIFEGIIVQNPLPNTLPPFLLPLILDLSFGLIALGFLRFMMSARSLSPRRMVRKLLRRQKIDSQNTTAHD